MLAVTPGLDLVDMRLIVYRLMNKIRRSLI